MRSRLLGWFWRDKLSLTIAYWINSLLLIAFFNLYRQTWEFIYPLVISSFAYLLLMAVEYARYAPFNNQLQRAIESETDFTTIRTATGEHERVAAYLNTLQTVQARQLSVERLQSTERNRFLSHWVHNMKTPVSVMTLIASKGSEEGSLTMTEIDDIVSECDRLDRLLDRALNVMRLQEFAQDFVPERINLLASLQQAINAQRSNFTHNSVFPVLKPPDRAAWILSDAKWNRFILEQVLSNAIKYSRLPGQNKHVHISFEQAGEHVLLKIKDEGCGIPAHDLHRVFEPFFTGENGRAHRDSTGVGLYLCAQICRHLGHQISIESALGTGTTVMISYLSATTTEGAGNLSLL